VTKQSTLLTPVRLSALDGVRGLGALAVLGLHQTGGRWPAQGGLAVDLFFLLSGYVLASVYEDRLRAALTLRDFLGQRLARFYPMYLLGAALALALVLVTPFSLEALPTFAANLLFMPRIGGTYWLNGPMWSLSLEMAVNVAFAAGMWRLSNARLALVIGAAAAVYFWIFKTTGRTDFGWQQFPALWVLGYVRVLFSFPLGWLLWRLRGVFAPYCTIWSPWTALAAVVATLIMPTGGLLDLAAIMLIYPLAVVALALGPQPTGLLGKLALLAGAISYPLYATHFPLVIFAKYMLPAPLSYVVGTVLALGVAWLAQRWIEPIGRRRLTAAFSRKPEIEGAVA
jgi:peptidoglycan/LPS O-acetylase OafA/YrhL